MKKSKGQKNAKKLVTEKDAKLKKHEDKELDDALKGTFPASDSTAKY